MIKKILVFVVFVCAVLAIAKSNAYVLKQARRDSRFVDFEKYFDVTNVRTQPVYNQGSDSPCCVIAEDCSIYLNVTPSLIEPQAGYVQPYSSDPMADTSVARGVYLNLIHMAKDYIFITKTISEHGKREIDSPKTNSSIRKIKIDKILKKDILSLKIYYEKVYNKSNYDYFIFGGVKPLAPTTINRHKIKACKKANLRSITLHQFRHSHATLLLHNGIVINEISRRLGHSTPSITLDIYTHTDLRQEKRVCETLNSLRFNLINTLTYIITRFLRGITIWSR